MPVATDACVLRSETADEKALRMLAANTIVGESSPLGGEYFAPSSNANTPETAGFFAGNAGAVAVAPPLLDSGSMHHRVIVLTSVLSICAANATAQQAQPAQAPQSPI